MDDSLKIDIEIMTENPGKYVNLKALTERFVRINEEYNNEPWNLEQILANIRMVGTIEIGVDV
jgi:hypothetical protein